MYPLLPSNIKHTLLWLGLFFFKGTNRLLLKMWPQVATVIVWKYYVNV